MKTTTPRRRWIGVASILIALCAPAAARAQGQPRPQADRSDMERRVRERFAETVKAELGITQEQLDRVGKVQQDFQKKREELARRDMALRRRMAPSADARPTDDEAKDMLKELAAVREDEAKLFRSEMDGLLDVLQPAQVLRFYELREQLMDRVRRLRQNGGGRGGPPVLRVGFREVPESAEGSVAAAISDGVAAALGVDQASGPG